MFREMEKYIHISNSWSNRAQEMAGPAIVDDSRPRPKIGELIRCASVRLP